MIFALRIDLKGVIQFDIYHYLRLDKRWGISSILICLEKYERRSFFIDLENVRSYGLEGILLLKPEDKVYVFYSDNANTLTIPTIESLNESSAQVKYIKTNYIGANAMDFQIVTLLGASIEKERTGRFYIISHDNGFRSAVKFCEGYFTGYDIVTGVFANILLAINSENASSEGADPSEGSDPTDKGSDPTADKGTDHDNDETSSSKSKSRNRRRRGRNKDRVEETTSSSSMNIDNADIDDTDSSESMTSQDGFMLIQASEDQKQNNAAAGKNAHRKKNNRRNDKSIKSDPTNKNVKNDKNESPSDKSGSYKYVYNALSEFLSKNTIDMYASSIDEGIRKSANRNDLHQFFKKKYGPDEAEALYKIIYSDFDKMKKEAGN